MFNIGWAELLVLTVAGLFILGPERLPAAAASGARLIRQIREYAASAKSQLQEEMGPEFGEIRKPLHDLAKLRKMDPKRAAVRHLFADLDTPSRPRPPDLTKRETTYDITTSVDPTRTTSDRRGRPPEDPEVT